MALAWQGMARPYNRVAAYRAYVHPLEYSAQQQKVMYVARRVLCYLDHSHAAVADGLDGLIGRATGRRTPLGRKRRPRAHADANLRPH